MAIDTNRPTYTFTKSQELLARAKKVVPGGRKVSTVTGGLLVAWGTWAILAAAF